MSDTREAIRIAVGGVLFNASNFPEKVQARILGQDMAPLTEKVTEAVLEAMRASLAQAFCDGESHAFGEMNEVRADALRDFATEFEATANDIEHGADASADYWTGATDATEYAVARIRSHADFLINGHDQ